MTARTFDELFEPDPPHLVMYQTDGQYTVVNIAAPNYPRMILPTERHIAAAWALAYQRENPSTRLDRASFMADPHSRRVPDRENVLQFRRRPLEPVDEEVGA